MNFNATSGARHPQGPGKKIKRVSDVNAVGPSIPTSQYVPPFNAPLSQPTMQPVHNQYTTSSMTGEFNNSEQKQDQNYIYSRETIQFPSYAPQNPQLMMGSAQGISHGIPNSNLSLGGGGGENIGFGAGGGIPPQMSGNFPQQVSMFQQPIVQDIAMQYGQKLADQGKQLVENHFEKYVPVTRLKYYFAVDNKYVINKLRLLFFPFTHKDWSLKYDQNDPVQPRYDINAVDLYIPSMAYITYVVLAGLMLGMQKRFSPEQLGIQASSALAYNIFELAIYSITLYVSNISTYLKTLDIFAFCGYKYVIILACLLISIPFQRTGYYLALIYCNLSLSFFLIRTLKTKVLHETGGQTSSTGGIAYDPYSGPQTHNFEYSTGRKRKLYFLLLVVGCQIFLSFWLSKHLILS